MERYPLTSCGKEIPNMIGIYFYVVPTEGTDENQRDELGYCGQAISVRPNKVGSVGIRQRSQSHFGEITKVKSSGRKAKGSLSAYNEFADIRVEFVELSVLSTFPFPRPVMGETIRHLQYIATLAETTDMLLLD
ncbi:hypothetical protein ACLX1H_010504 [Fusarium chlamydosporum]